MVVYLELVVRFSSLDLQVEDRRMCRACSSFASKRNVLVILLSSFSSSFRSIFNVHIKEHLILAPLDVQARPALIYPRIHSMPMRSMFFKGFCNISLPARRLRGTEGRRRRRRAAHSYAEYVVAMELICNTVMTYPVSCYQTVFSVRSLSFKRSAKSPLIYRWQQGNSISIGRTLALCYISNIYFLWKKWKIDTNVRDFDSRARSYRIVSYRDVMKDFAWKK